MDSFVKLITVFNIKIINRSNKNYQCRTKELLDLSMTRIDRVFVTDYVYVKEWIKKISKSESWETCRNIEEGSISVYPRRAEDVTDH
jgi:hypothetical protein